MWIVERRKTKDVVAAAWVGIAPGFSARLHIQRTREDLCTVCRIHSGEKDGCAANCHTLHWQRRITGAGLEQIRRGVTQDCRLAVLLRQKQRYAKGRGGRLLYAGDVQPYRNGFGQQLPFGDVAIGGGLPGAAMPERAVGAGLDVSGSDAQIDLRERTILETVDVALCV